MQTNLTYHSLTNRREQKLLLLAVLAVTLGSLASPAVAEDPYDLAWTRQLGTPAWDESTSAAVDAVGNVFISGWTGGNLEGSNAGGRDAFLRKYDTSGNVLWTRQLGTSENEYSYAVAADTAGNVFISGSTYGTLNWPNEGNGDAFLSKYDSSGSLVWTRQLGTSNYDSSYGMAVATDGNVLITGPTWGNLGGTYSGYDDAFVSKYDTSGNVLWTRQLGTSDSDDSHGVTTDGVGNVFITGFTAGSLDGTNAGDYDAYLSKYDASGNPLWTRQLGTANNDGSFDVAADTVGNVFITGRTAGNLDGSNAGSNDIFVSKYDTQGSLIWTRQQGTSGEEDSRSVAVDAAGNIFISGGTRGNLGGTNAGDFDAFVTKYDTSGSLLWSHQLGTSSADDSHSVALDASGNVFISGRTNGSLGGPNAGSYDAFVVKFNVPEPSTLGLLLAGGLVMLRRRGR